MSVFWFLIIEIWWNGFTVFFIVISDKFVLYLVLHFLDNFNFFDFSFGNKQINIIAPFIRFFFDICYNLDLNLSTLFWRINNFYIWFVFMVMFRTAWTSKLTFGILFFRRINHIWLYHLNICLLYDFFLRTLFCNINKIYIRFRLLSLATLFSIRFRFVRSLVHIWLILIWFITILININDLLLFTNCSFTLFISWLIVIFYFIC